MNPLQRELLLLNEKIIALTSNASARHLLASVAQNPSTETFMILDSQASVSKEIDSLTDGDLQHRTITDLLNGILIPLQALFCSPVGLAYAASPEFYTSALGTPGLRAGYKTVSTEYEHIRDKWLFENLTRLKKWLIVAKVLAYKRLCSFKNSDGTNVVPTPMDTPSQIMELWVLVNDFERNRQPAFREVYARRLAENVDLDFLALGYGVDIGTPKKTVEKFIEEHRAKRMRVEENY